MKNIECLDVLPNGYVIAAIFSHIMVWNGKWNACLYMDNKICNLCAISNELISLTNRELYVNWPYEVWNIKTGKRITKHNYPNCRYIHLQDGRLMYTTHDTIIIVNMEGEIEDLSFRYNEHIQDIKQHPDGRILSIHADGTFRVWNLLTGQCDSVTKICDKFKNQTTIIILLDTLLMFRYPGEDIFFDFYEIKYYLHVPSIMLNNNTICHGFNDPTYGIWISESERMDQVLILPQSPILTANESRLKIWCNGKSKTVPDCYRVLDMKILFNGQIPIKHHFHADILK